MPVTDISYNYITVSFNAPLGSPPIGYYATAVPTTTYNKQTKVVSPKQTTTTPIKFNGLISGTTYNINVTSLYSIGNTVSEGISANTLSAPPTRLSVTNPNVNSLTVGFSPPLGSTPIGYYVTAIPTSTDNGQTTVITSQTTSTLITISSLISGTTYDIYVSSVYDTGDVISVVSQGSTLSNPPSNLIITDISYTYLNVGYTISFGSTALGYFATAKSTYDGTIITSSRSFSNPLTVDGLVSGTTYKVTVSAAYTNTSASSTFITASTPSNPPIISGITDSSYNFLTVTFTEPAGNTPNTYYATAVPLRTDNSQQTVVSSSINSITPIKLSGLISGSTYYITVSAVYNNGTITSTSVAGNTTSTYPTSLVLSNPTVYSLTLGFTPPICSPPLGYYATAIPLESDNYQSIVTTGITTSTIIPINGLISGTIYNVSVTAVFDTGNVVSTSSVQGVTVSNPPTSVTVTSLLTNSISISYLAPVGNTPKSYYSIATPNTTDNNQVVVSTIGAPTNNLYLTIPGLVSGTNYTIIAYSRYSNGDVASNSIVAGTASYPPTGLMFVVATISSITLSFTPPLGSTPSSYLATTSLGGSGTAISSATQITITGLLSNTTYPGITITAIYSSGNATSTPFTASTIGLPPTNLTVIDVSVNYITVSFNPTSTSGSLSNSASLPNSYTATTNQGGAGTAGSSANTITIFGLNPNTNYTGIAVTSVYTGGIITSDSISYYTLGYMATDLLTTSHINSIDVNFTAPLQTNPPLGYFARAVPNITNNGQTTITYPVNVSTTTIPTFISTIPLTIPGLISGTIYTITLNSVYISGTVASPNITGTTLSNPPTLSYIYSENNALTVYFTPPVGSLPLSYSATANPEKNNNAQIIKNITNIARNETSYKFNNLVSGTIYDISMSAVYSTTNSSLNATTSYISGTTLSSGPKITQVNKDNVVDSSTNSITVYFTEPDGFSLPISYNATAVPRTTNNTQQVVNVTGIAKNATSVIIGNLVSGTVYDISMATVYDSGNVSSNVYFGATTLSNPPTNVLINTNSLTDPSTNSITVYFTPPIGSLPISYTALANPLQTGNDQQIVNVTGISRTSNSVVISELISGTTYDVTMTSVYNTGTLSSSPIVKGNTLINPPTLVSIGDVSTNALTVYFTPPIGSLPLSYSATAKPRQTNNEQIEKNIINISRVSTSYQFTGLVSGTIYDISMSAVYDISTNSTINSLPGTTLSTAPTLIATNTNSSDISTNALTVYFTAPIGSLPLSYSATANPKQTTNSQIIKSITGISRTATSYEFTELVSGTTYDVSISAVYNISTNSTTNFISGNTIIKPPTIVSIGDASTNALTVYFTPPIGSLPLSYSATANPRQTTNSQIIKNISGISRVTTSYQFTELVSGTTYDISMSSVYDISINSTTTLAGDTLSNPPTLTGINTDSLLDPSTNAVKVYFTPPVGSLPISYLATVTPETKYNNQVSKTITTIGVNDLSFVVTDLISGTTYDVSMAAIYNIATNRTTSIVSGSTLANSPTITNIANSNIDGKLVISYSDPNPGSLPVGYSIVATPIANNGQTTITSPNNPSIINKIDSNSNPITLTGLISGTTYNCVLTAYYDLGGYSSTSVAGNTYSSPPSGLSISPATITTTTITVSFNAPSGTAPLGYTVSYIVSGSTNGSITTSETSSTLITIGSLNPGTTYILTVTAIYNRTYSGLNSSATIAGTTYGVAPTALSTTSATSTSITVTYTLPSTTPNYYSLSATPSGTTYGQTITVLSLVSPIYTITGLIPGTPYVLSLSAVYTNNTQTTNTIAGSTTYDVATSLIIPLRQLYSLDVSFVLPLATTVITNLKMYASAIPQNTQRGQPTITTGTVAALSISNSGISIPGLISGTQYRVYVYSKYDVGDKVSDYVSGNTLANPPTNLTTTDISYSFITVGFTAPIGSTPISYTAGYSTNGGTTYTTTSTQSGTTFKITGLNAGTMYNIRSTAAYETGNLSTVDIIGNTTAIPVTIGSITSANTSFTVSFNVPNTSPTQSIPNSYYAIATPDSGSILGQQVITTSTIAGTSNSISITGLTAGTLYNSIVIYSQFPNTTVNSLSSSSITLTPAPTIVTTSSTSLTSITVNFTVPSPLTAGLKYFAQAYTTSNQYVTDTSGNGTTTTSSTTITIPGLMTNFTYNIYVCAYYNSAIIGRSATPLSVSTSTISPTALYNANVTLQTSLLVGFTLVTDLGGSTPLYYIAQVFSASDTTYSTPISYKQGNSSPILLDTPALTPGTTYKVRVGALYSAIGTPSYSTIYNLDTDS